jgi:predicted alpha/beta-fold hydrolase
MTAMSEFSPAWFARGPHVQTIWGRLVRPRRMVKLEREEIETPDGDELVLDHLRGERMHFILMHGLEGSANSVYIQGMLSLIAKRGFAATAINFRSCARDPLQLDRMLPNRRPRFYHSGETTDFDFVARTLHSRAPKTPLVACGASLGGNALLKWLGEHPVQQIIRAAATLSVPYDLGAGGTYLERGLGPFYVGGFLRTLKKKVNDVAKRFPETRLDIPRAMRAKTFREFDDVATAPLHGFADADDYYARSSSIHYLSRITTPVLCISAEDDPFLPPEVLERAKAVASPSVEFITTRHGGHVGFVGGSLPWKSVYWAEELVVDWLADNIES